MLAKVDRNLSHPSSQVLYLGKLLHKCGTELSVTVWSWALKSVCRIPRSLECIIDELK